jgi:asparagine synthase (glutamine-hydrolysing)
MCGILILWAPKQIDRDQFKRSLRALTPRGPDVAHDEVLVHGPSDTEIGVGFVRLHIQGATGGAEQPFRLQNGNLMLTNGEIFNSEILVRQLSLRVPEGSSDCAVIPALLDQHGLPLADVAKQLDGDFATVLVDLSAGMVRVARDPYGVRPLFYAEGPAGGWRCVASEIKGIPADATLIRPVEPGTVIAFPLAATQTDQQQQPQVWHTVPWLKTPYWRSSLEALTHGGAALRHALEEAVAKRLSTVRSLGACLSGGLDSSLVAAIAARRLARVGKRLHTYTVGMEGSPDVIAARQVAAHIGSIHHERILTPEECLAAIPDVVKAIESFDITTVRASVGNYMVARLVTEVTPEVKVVLNGDGSDEVLGGYLYMRAAPDDAAFELETDRLLRDIHYFDVLRSERTMAAHGLESRSPFLDRQFVAVARSLPTDALRPTETMMEKTILRTAFADAGLLPRDILWRRKEAFSDGISRAEKSWFEMAKAEGEKRSGSDSWATAAAAYTVNPPPTAEALYYRQLFHESYPAVAAAAATPYMWMPRFIAGATDPSARTLKLYAQ